MSHTANPTIPLRRRQTFPLQARIGERIECRSGQVWITQDGDPRDVVLRHGECFTLDRKGQALVSALEDASIVVRPPGDTVLQAAIARTPRIAPEPACAY
jgi:hypothetical protein